MSNGKYELVCCLFGRRFKIKYKSLILVVSILTVISSDGFCSDPLNLGPEELVKANSVEIDVGTYSVPSFVDWDNDYLKDLVVGTGGGKVCVYINVGTESNPQFSNYFYAQSDGNDLYCEPSGCMGCFPRVVYWDADTRKDLIVGQADGTIMIFLNINTDNDPNFDGGTLLQVGQPGLKADIDVGARAAPCIVDWNNDGRKDLVVGAYDGQIHIFLNEGTDSEPNFLSETFVQEDGSNLDVPSNRSSPAVFDVDDDGRKDLLAGNTNGQLLYYRNMGTDTEPNFSGYVAVESDGVPIDLPDYPRSRPSVCYWTGDGYFGPIDDHPDVLIGASDGKIHLYQGIPMLGDIDGDGSVDLNDFVLLGNYWQQINCGDCGGVDLTGDGNVNLEDLRELTDDWLLGK